ncbi:hypothetical protein [Tichowtungia aerotolerans]|uniref:Uncharacterized protein n=1 Tax=Tichowtungia aerotolerans TaxID=2697043 RepID=A0A6P1MGF7_9BACT|nr:hypothetical protein [Tichowtungia aerotolerans]QHI70676.1 hypothetical protein GT409_14925 [Tichowtungia aerotolerans]
MKTFIRSFLLSAIALSAQGSVRCWHWNCDGDAEGGSACRDGRQINRLRVDPIGSAGANFEIDWIRAANGDADGDGFPDWAESAYGTGRLNPDDGGFRVQSDLPLQLDGKAGLLYSLQRATSLLSNDWKNVEAAVPLTLNQPVVFTSGALGINGFYHVQVEFP